MFLSIVSSYVSKDEYALNLGKFAAQNSVKLLFKNECIEYNGHFVRGFGSDAKVFAELIERLNEKLGDEIFGMCIDSGVCNLCGQDMREYIICMSKYIKAVILRENDGHMDANMLPFSCLGDGVAQMDWLRLVRGLREIMFDGLFVIDIHDTYNVFPPMLKGNLMKLAKKNSRIFQMANRH